MEQDTTPDPPPRRRMDPPTTVLLARRLDAPPERVFDVWLDPEMARQWIVAPSPNDEVTLIKIDARIGGAFSFVLVRNGKTIDTFGGYIELERPRRLAFTWSASIAGKTGWGSVVTLTLAPAGSGTELRLTHEGVPTRQALRTEEGWSKVIQALATAIG